MKTEYNAIWVTPETHKKFKLKAVEERMTFDELLNKLIDDHENKHYPV